MSPLFSLPGFLFEMICVDVLHAMDLGITQDAIGNLLYECLGTVFKGPNKALQLEQLKAKLKQYYKDAKAPNRINNVTMEMIKVITIRHTDTHRHTHTDTHTDTQTHTQTHTQAHTQTHIETCLLYTSPSPRDRG